MTHKPIVRYDNNSGIEIMKKKTRKKTHSDDSLFGLLVSYKGFNTYIRIFLSEENKKVRIELTNNPKKWMSISKEIYDTYRELSRLELGIEKKSIKYILPRHIVHIRGPLLGIKIPNNRYRINNRLDDEGYYILETSSRYKSKVIQGIKKLINLNPQKKYEILEKSLALHQDEQE